METQDTQKKFQAYYGGLQFEYFMTTSALASFTSVFMLPNGFSNGEVGLVLALGNLLAVIMQPFFADYADHTKRFGVDQLISIAVVTVMALCSSLFIFKGRTIALAIFYVLMIGIHTTIQPFLYELNFRLEKIGIHMNFGVARAMGSIGYAIMCAVLGYFVEEWGISMIPISAELVMFVMLCNLFLLRRKYTHISCETEDIQKEDHERISLKDFMKDHKLLLILNIGVMLLTFHNVIFSGFMLQIMKSVGGGSEQMGTALSLMAFLEVPSMICFDRLKDKFGSIRLLKLSCYGFMLKNILFLMAKSVKDIYIAQLSQVIAFALFMPAMVAYIHERMQKGEQVKGQALFTTMLTAGGIIGNFFGGILIDQFGVKNMLAICLGFTVVGVSIILFTADKIKPLCDK